MSLRVWLPLDGNLHNQGISDYTPTLASNNTWATSGKIGNKSLTLIKIQTILPTSSCMTGAKEISYCYWIKVNTAWSTNWLDGIRWIETNGSATATARQEFYTNCTLIGTWYKGGAISGKSFTPGKWIHLAATFNYNTGEVKFYINGTLSGSTSDLDTTYYCRGDFYIGDNGTDICENDVRIYDHCLSAAEVKEIAQGLVLHYKLDGGLFGNKNILTNSSGQLGNATGWTGETSASTMNGEPILITKRINTSSTSRTFCHHGNIQSLITDWAAGDDYTVSGWYYVPSSETQQTGANLFIRWTYTKTDGTVTTTDKGFTTPLTPTDQWIYFKYTWQVPAGHTNDQAAIFYLAAFAAQSLSTVYWKKIKLEKGSVATPWCPADSEMSINRTIVEDSSGYNHNGTLTGAAAVTSETPRYNVSTHFSATNQYIHASTLTTSGFGSTYTFAWWEKRATYSNTMAWGFQNGIRLNGLYNGNLWNTGDSGNNPLYKPGTTTTVTVPTTNVWHHFAMVADGSTCKVYQDGELWAQAKTFKQISGTNLYINGWDTGTSYKNSNMSISDFRIYCTPLLDTDIKQLYNVGMKVDKFGNIHPFELEENINMVSNVKFINNSANSITYDATTDTYTIISKADTSSWGYGVRLADDPPLWIPYGATYRWTAEVWTPIALNVNTDYNNTTGNADTNWAGNDNDTTGTRLTANVAIPANKWTRIYRGASNTNNGNTNHLPIRDYSSLGLVTNGQSNPVTWKVRHLQWYIADTEFKPQIKRTGIFKASHFTETEEDLDKPAQFNKKMLSVNATQFIEH